MKRAWQIVIDASTRIENGEEGEEQPEGLSVKAEGRSMIVLARRCDPCGRSGPLGI